MGQKWCAVFLTCLLILMIAVGSITVIVDPYFHYHAPLDQLEYPLNDQRYQNDGIVKHFDYDAIITGTSMTENFKSSEFDALFGVRSVKVPLSGGYFKEVNDLVSRAIKTNPKIKIVIRSLDSYMLLEDKNRKHDTFQYPDYLYDDNPFNDVEYIFNKDILMGDVIDVFDYTASGNITTGFDEYSSWDRRYIFAKETVLEFYDRPEESGVMSAYTADDEASVKDTVLQNIIAEAKKNPDIQFYYFIPPYSTVWWDRIERQGKLERQISALETMSELLVEVENVKLFSFAELFEMTSDLSNYKDYLHYSAEINSFILESMRNEDFMLTEDNYKKHWQNVRDYYLTFDYDEYFEMQEYDLIRQNAQESSDYS